jgi:hypothetical protein
VQDRKLLFGYRALVIAIAACFLAIAAAEAMYTPTKLHPAKDIDPQFALDWPAEQMLGAMALRVGVRFDGKDAKASLCYGKRSSKRACVWHLTAKGRSRRADTVWRLRHPEMSDLLIVVLAAGDYCFDGFLAEKYFVSTTEARGICIPFTIQPNKLTYVGDVLAEANSGKPPKKASAAGKRPTPRDPVMQTAYGKASDPFRILITISQSDVETLLESLPNIEKEDIIWREAPR